MDITDELQLSYYKSVADVNAKHGVQLVQHTQTGKFYIKKRLTEYNAQVFRRLQEHPVKNVPRIYAVVECDGVLTVVEEFISGDTLQEILEREGPLSEDCAADLVIQLCRILSELHHREPPLIHRDIKPSNLMLSPDGVLKLLDFNAAKFSHEEEPRDTKLLGTSGYAAPEQYGFSPSTEKTDLYAVGILLNVLLTGHIPTEQKATGRLAGLIETCTKMNPFDRPDSVDDLLEELLAFRGGSNVPKKHPRRRFLPPGFRTGKTWHMALAVIGYFLIFLVANIFPVGFYRKGESVVISVVLFLMMLSIVFFSANYGGIHQQLALTRSRNPAIRFLGVVLYDLVILFLFVLLMFCLYVGYF